MQFLCAFLRTVMGRFLSTRDAKIISIVIHVMHLDERELCYFLMAVPTHISLFPLTNYIIIFTSQVSQLYLTNFKFLPFYLPSKSLSLEQLFTSRKLPVQHIKIMH